MDNFIAVKYHVETDFPKDHIALHNFKDGYCGISKIEGNAYCLCYLTTAKNLRHAGNSIKKMEEEILQQNPFLKNIFSSATFLYQHPLTISQISFSRKSQVYEHILLTGDAAGSITPLCGNGMSMALHGSKIAFKHINTFLSGKIDRFEMEKRYETEWKNNFSRRR